MVVYLASVKLHWPGKSKSFYAIPADTFITNCWCKCKIRLWWIMSVLWKLKRINQKWHYEMFIRTAEETLNIVWLLLPGNNKTNGSVDMIDLSFTLWGVLYLHINELRIVRKGCVFKMETSYLSQSLMSLCIIFRRKLYIFKVNECLAYSARNVTDMILSDEFLHHSQKSYFGWLNTTFIWSFNNLTIQEASLLYSSGSQHSHDLKPTLT